MGEGNRGGGRDVTPSSGSMRARTWGIEAGVLPRPLVIAHRGASAVAPENTLAALDAAVEAGADGVEIDVRLTKDGRVVVCHDRRVDRTTAGRGPVGSYTLAQLKELDAGSWFGPRFRDQRLPTLEEVLDSLPTDVLIYVEMKARGPAAWPLVHKVAEVLRAAGQWERVMVAGFNPLAMTLLRMVEPKVVRGYVWSRRHPLPLSARWLSTLVRPQWLAPDRGTFTPKVLRRFHSQGLPVIAWDIDSGGDMGRMADIGLDAVVANDPEALVRQLPLNPTEE